MSRCYDAIVIGAGPAGSATAGGLAGAGLSVLLLERHFLPRDKPCGGGLTPKAWPLLPVAVDDLVLNHATSVLVRKGPSLSTHFRSQKSAISMVRRREFDQRLAEAAVARGVMLHQGELFRSLETGATVRVVSDRGSYQARAVIGADGAESRVARLLGLPRPRRWMVALDAEVEMENDLLAGEAVVDLGVPHGYAWVFPKGRVYNVGIGTFHPGYARELRWRLQRFAFESGLPTDRLAPWGHRIPTGLAPGPLHRRNVLLVGDAAGVADPFFAEGISYALLTGHMAVDAVVDYLAGRSPDLSSYTRQVKAALAMDNRLWGLTSSLVYRFPALSLRILAASRWLQIQVEKSIAGEVGFCQGWCGRTPAAPSSAAG